MAAADPERILVAEREVVMPVEGLTRAALDAATQAVAAGKAKLATAARASPRRSKSRSPSAPRPLDLARTTVRAPADGVVSQTSRLQVGTVTPSGVLSLSLVISNRSWVEANFKEARVARTTRIARYRRRLACNRR